MRVSGQVKEISSDLNKRLLDQRELITDIEANVEAVDENVDNADNEINQADMISRGTNSKLWILVLLGTLIVIGLIVLIWYLMNSKE